MIAANPFRFRLISVGVLILTLVLLARIFFIQIVLADYYSDKADRQYNESTSSLFERGTIYFQARDGKLVPAAVVKNGYLLAINPQHLADAGNTYKKLAAIVEIDQKEFLAKASLPDDPYEEIKRRLSKETADRISELNLAGVGVYKDRWRFYPAGRLAAHLIGIIGYREDELIGRYGLERQYEETLRRRPDKSFVSFIAETLAGIGQSVIGKNLADSASADLVLTVEPLVQKGLETELESAWKSRSAASAGGVVLDPRTGAVLAMVALPNFDPGHSQTDLSLLTNPLVENVFEMGSIVKPLTIAAGLDAGVIETETEYQDLGSVFLNNYRITNYDGKARGKVPMQEILNQSLNTGAVFVMQKLGLEKFRQYFLNFGLGEKTGIDLPGEVAGLTGNLDSNREIDYATASFGQGIAPTPIGIAGALAALANGGLLVKPYVVARFDYPNKISRHVKPKVIRRVLKPETSEEITRMLVTVVDDALRGGKFKMSNYTIAAKTGTAQMIKGDGGYYDDRYLHSFFGYFPAYEPRFFIFLYLTDPRGVRYASESLTEPFMNLAKFLLNYYNISPDRQERQTEL